MSQWRLGVEVKDTQFALDKSFSAPDIHYRRTTSDKLPKTPLNDLDKDAIRKLVIQRRPKQKGDIALSYHHIHNYETPPMEANATTIDYPEKSVWEFYENQRRQDFSWNICPPQQDPNNRSKLCLTCTVEGKKTCFQKAEALVEKNEGWIEKQAIATIVQKHPDDCCTTVTRQRIVPAPMRAANQDPIPEVYKQMDGKSNITAWCILEGDNTPRRKWLKGFSHAAQALVPCWSYFMRAREVAPNAKFGILLGKPQMKSPMANLSPAWTKGLVRGMECDLVLDEEDNIPALKATAPSAPSSSWYFRPDNKDFEDWFQYPSDATKLTNQVIDNYQQTRGIKPPSFSENTLKIGLVQRRGARNIANMEEIQEKIKQTYPDAIVEWGEMENMTFIEQVHFWNRQDVVVAAHGAAMTNAIFMRRKTSVVEIFPPHYYVMMYREMCEAAGVYHFAWMDDVAVPEYDYELHCSKRYERWEIRSAAITPPVDRVLDLVAQAVNATKGRLKEA